MLDHENAPEGMDEWLAANGKGASAWTIAMHLAGVGDGRSHNGAYPKDAEDFGRCERLLRMVPSLRAEMPRMAEVNDYWAALAPRWNEIKRTLNQSALIKEIVGPIQEADPAHVQLSPGVSMSFPGLHSIGGEEPDGDHERYRKAVVIVLSERKCSTSFIQRKLVIGYNAAARIVERMEEEGIVSKPDHIGKREILKSAPDAIEQAAEDTRSKMEEKARKGRAPMKEDADFRDHNDQSYRVTARELRQFIERFERLEVEKKDIADQQKEVMAEAKARGYDTKVMRKIVALRKRDKDDIAEEEAVLEMYKSALGM